MTDSDSDSDSDWTGAPGGGLSAAEYVAASLKLSRLSAAERVASCKLEGAVLASLAAGGPDSCAIDVSVTWEEYAAVPPAAVSALEAWHRVLFARLGDRLLIKYTRRPPGRPAERLFCCEESESVTIQQAPHRI